MSEPYKIIAIAGSLRKASANKGLLRYAKEHSKPALDIEIIDIIDIPFYNQDVQDQGIPSAVALLAQKIKQADGLLFACTEYNYSMAPALKNALDWLSKLPDNPLPNKPVAIVGAGGGMGTSRAQYHLRQTCVYLDLHPMSKPEFFANAFSGCFNEHGDLIGSNEQSFLKELLTEFSAWIKIFKGQ